MTDEREQAIADLVAAVRKYESPRGLPGFEVIRSARKLADIESPPLPDEREVLVTRDPTIDNTYWPNGWGSVFGVDLPAEKRDYTQVYRCRLTPLERVR